MSLDRRLERLEGGYGGEPMDHARLDAEIEALLADAQLQRALEARAEAQGITPDECLARLLAEVEEEWRALEAEADGWRR